MYVMDDKPKRFYRSRDKVIGGVCGGIANYLNIDVTLVRILALISIFLGSLGFWAYMIFWIVAPEEPNNIRR